LFFATAETRAGGSGRSPTTRRQMKAAGVDAFTMGDHIYKKAEIISGLEAGEPIVKPANLPAAAPGKDHLVVQTKAGVPVAIVSLLGRTFMRPVDCPFQAVDRVLAQIPPGVRCSILDAHEEATEGRQLCT